MFVQAYVSAGVCACRLVCVRAGDGESGLAGEQAGATSTGAVLRRCCKYSRSERVVDPAFVQRERGGVVVCTE